MAGGPWDEEGFGGDDEWEGGDSLVEESEDTPELDIDLEELGELEDVELEDDDSVA
jgi:hypothetical protein